jgi:hypothetical protein
MEKPKYFDEMLPYFPQDIEVRIEEIEKELKELKTLKSSNRLSSEDIEDVSDNYQYHLEWNCAISELNDELKCLKYQQYLDAKNESELNALESQTYEG